MTLREQTHADINLSHSAHELSLELRVFREAGLNFFRRFIKNFPSSDGVATRFIGIGHFEHAGHEFSDAIGAVAFASDAAQLHSLHDGESDEKGETAGGYGDGKAMAANVFAESIRSTGRTRAYRPVLEIAFDVSGKFRRRAVATVAVSLESFHGDPIEIAAEKRDELSGLETAKLGALDSSCRVRQSTFVLGLGGSSSRRMRRSLSSGCFLSC